MSDYEPELGQAIFGNGHENHDASHLSEAMYELSEALGKLNPDKQSHGLLGGDYGYGQAFKNDVFEMRPYYWGDCECTTDTHEAGCVTMLPNFHHFKTGLRVSWYKYIGRGMSANQDVTTADFGKIAAECIKSLRDTE